MKKNGINKFVFNVLETVETEDKRVAYKIETDWINKLKSNVSGYNTVVEFKDYVKILKHKADARDRAREKTQ